MLINGVPYSGGATYVGADRQIDVSGNVISVAMPFEKFIPYGEIFTLITQDAFGNNYTLSYDGDLLYLSGFEVKIASDAAVKFEGLTSDSTVYMTGSGCVGCTNVPPANTQIGDWTAARTFSNLYGTSGGSVTFNGAGGITIADSSNNASMSFSNNGYSFGAASTLPVLGNQVYGVHVFAGGPSGTNSTYPNIAGFSSSRYVMMFANDRIWWRRTVTGWLTPLRPTDVTGTANQITVTATNTGVTLSLPSTVNIPTIQQSGVQVIDTLAAGTGITITGSGNSRTISASGSSGVTSLAGTAGQITASASTGAVTLSVPNPRQPANAPPSVLSVGPAVGTGALIGTVIGTNNAFWFEVTTGSGTSTGVIATFSYATAWDVTQDVNGPACSVSIINAEGTADASTFMTTYGPRLYAIGTSGNVATRLDVKLAGGTGSALPATTTFKLKVTCDLSK